MTILTKHFNVRDYFDKAYWNFHTLRRLLWLPATHSNQNNNVIGNNRIKRAQNIPHTNITN